MSTAKKDYLHMRVSKELKGEVLDMANKLHISTTDFLMTALEYYIDKIKREKLINGK